MDYMAKKVEMKQPVIEEIKALVDGAKAVVIADYRGITVEQDTALRKELREAGVTYKVYKNTMVKIAVKGTEFEPLVNDLEGPTAVAVSKEDAAVPARVLFNFIKKAPALELKAGVVDGTYYDKNGIQLIATIPSREELLGKLLGSIQSPITNFARVLKQIAEAKEA
jgi:large subunit ribosomal protein L10